MADSRVEVTSGTGTSIDTRTESTNGHHRQVVVVGDPTNNAGVAPVDASAGLKVDLGADNDVTVASLPLPSGASTSAKQDTGNTSLSAINTDTTAIAAAVKAEDAAHSSGDKGVMPLAVRNDTRGALAGTDGDYIPLTTNSSGDLRVDGSAVTQPVSASSLPLPTGAATSTKQSDGSQKTQIVDGSGNVIGATSNALDVNIKSGAAAGTQYTEDAAAAGDPVGTALNLIRKDTLAGLTSADGDNVAARGTDKGELYVKHVDAIPVTDNSGSLTVDGTVSITDNSSVNVAQLAGTTTDTDSGTKSAGTLRVVIATDQPQLTKALKVDGSAVTQPVSGSVTANAGTNLNTSALALESGGNLATIAGAVRAEDAASADGHTGIPALAVRKATPANTSGTDGDYENLQMSAGRLWVDPSGVTLTVASHAVTNAGTFAVQESGTQVLTDDAAFTPATTKVVMAGFEADESSTDSVDEGDGGAARMTLDRKQIVTVYPHTANGLSTFNATSSDGATALTNSAQAIKASAGQVYGYYIYNPNATAQFVQFYNTASGLVTVGTTNPLFMLTIPATSAANLMSTHGIEFTNAGFSISATSTAGGNGAPSTALDAVVWYK